MAYASTAVVPNPFVFSTLPAFDAHVSLWHMVKDAVAESRQAQIDHEIESLIVGSGGKFTDETEREIERICGSHPGGW